MKKLTVILGCLIFSLGISAEEFAIQFKELPAPSILFIQTHFKDVVVKKTVIEKRASLLQYEVDLKGGIDLQFDRQGHCTEVNCKNSAVPPTIIPKKIQTSVLNQFPKNEIRGYEHNGRLYEIELDNGISLTYNKSFRLIDIDK